MTLNKQNSYLYLIVLVVFLTNITQIPQIVSLGLTSSISILIWLILLFIIILRGKIYFKNLFYFFSLVTCIFLLLIFISQIITGNNYINSSIVYPFMLSIFVLFIGLQSSISINIEQYNCIYYSYIMSGFIVAIFVLIDVLNSGFSWSTIGYAYSSKNSVSQIILTVLILLIFVKFPGRKIATYFCIISSSFLIILLCMLKSRASLIGLVLLLFVFLVNKNIRLHVKIIVLTIIIIGILFILNNNYFYEIIVDNILFANKNSLDLNSLSSGRYDMFKEFPKLFWKSPLIGRGSYYIESFPLSILVQYGIVGSIPIILLLLIPIFHMISMKYKNNMIFISITICYYFNGFFEELAPIGPGVKCYFLWLLLGLLLGRKELDTIYAKKKNIRS